MIICADDFGLAADINRAILDLATRRRLSAVSCMVALPDCRPGDLQPLLSLQPAPALGLHLCLTPPAVPAASRPLPSLAARRNFFSYRRLLRGALLRRIDPEDVRSEVAAQYRLFQDKCGRAPDFIDSHLHLHQLPGFRDGLLAFILSLPAAEHPWVRNAHMPLVKLLTQNVSFWKGLAISGFGKTCRARLRAAGLSTNHGFAGVYDYRRWKRYGEYLPRFVRHLESPSGIIMTHPGLDEPWRRMEYETLRDFPFPEGLISPGKTL